ncbi:MAG: AEC family transporter [Butyricicoccaceae bacterium]
MIAVGAFLAQCDLRECFRDTQVYFVSALRLLILPLITLAVFLLLPLDHTLRCSMLISAAAPVAMAASLFGKTYGTDYLFSTRATAVSTIFSAPHHPGDGRALSAARRLRLSKNSKTALPFPSGRAVFVHPSKATDLRCRTRRKFICASFRLRPLF